MQRALQRPKKKLFLRLQQMTLAGLLGQSSVRQRLCYVRPEVSFFYRRDSADFHFIFIFSSSPNSVNFFSSLVSNQSLHETIYPSIKMNNDFRFPVCCARPSPIFRSHFYWQNMPQLILVFRLLLLFARNYVKGVTFAQVHSNCEQQR